MWSLQSRKKIGLKLASEYTELFVVFSREMKNGFATAHPFLSLFFQHIIRARHQKDKRECSIQAKHPHSSSATI